MREVPAVLYGLIRETFEQHGIDTSTHLRGLELARVSKLDFGVRVDWDELAIFMNRCSEGMSEEEQKALGARYASVNHFFSLVLRLAVSPIRAYRVLFALVRQAYPHMDAGCRSLPDGRVLGWLVLPDGYEPCPVFFRGTVGEVRTLPQLVGLDPAEVEADVGPRHGHYYASIQESPEARSATDGLVEALVGDLERSLAFALGRGGASASTVQSLQRELGLTRAEARVAMRIGRGASVADIAADLGVAVETVRTHLKRIYAKTGARRQSELARLVLSKSRSPAG